MTVDGGDAAGGRGGGTGGASGRAGADQADATPGMPDARASCGTDSIAWALTCPGHVDGYACVSGCTVADGGTVDGCTFGARYCIPAGTSCADVCP